MENQIEPKVTNAEVSQVDNSEKKVVFFDAMGERFQDVFNSRFLYEAIHGDKLKKTWQFWFFINTLAVIVFTVVSVYKISGGINEFVGTLNEKYPDAAIVIEKGKLSTKGMEDPFLENIPEDKAVFIVDTKNEIYGPSDLDSYEEGAFISAEKIYYKKNAVETQEFSFKEIDNFSFSEKDLVGFIDRHKMIINLGLGAIIFLFSWIYYSGFRLISACFWAFLLWIGGKIANANGLTFEKAYLSMLNFYAIPLLIVDGLAFFNFGFPFFTTLVILAIFVINLMQFKKLQKEVVAPIAIKNQ